MRAMLGFVVIVIALAAGYWFYMSSLKTTETKENMVSVVGVKADLLSFANAERIYAATHGAYASEDELYSSGTLKTQRPARDGYTYSWGSSSQGFSIIARCQLKLSVPCPSFSIDQDMQIEQLPDPQPGAHWGSQSDSDSKGTVLSRLKSDLSKLGGN